MDKETLSNYGWIVICVLVLAVMIALATPFGQFVADGFNSAKQGLFDTGDSAMDVALGAVGVCEHTETEIANTTADYSGDTVCKKCGFLIATGKHTVPEGGIYTTADGTVYNPGDEMPETVTTGDKYTNGDYEYRYNQYTNGKLSWTTDEEQNGWGVDTIVNTNQTYGKILTNINGEPITSMRSTFDSCTSLTTAPAIPSTITTMYRTFSGCLNLITPPNISHCTQLTDMRYAFMTCNKITITPIIPEGVIDMSYAFQNSGIVTAHAIPSSVTNMKGTFSGCARLYQAPTIPSNVTILDSTFNGCTKLKTAPVIPNGVTSMNSTFGHCTSLTTVPVIPSSVTSLGSTFFNCTSLVIAPAIPDSVTYMSSAFYGCTSLTTAPVIPSSVTNMQTAFKNCTSLTGTITINANPQYYGDSFDGVDFAAQNLTLTGDSTRLDSIGTQGTNYCKTCNGKCNGGH